MYNVPSGAVKPGQLYKVAGEEFIVYNSITYDIGDRFRGISDITTYTTSGAGASVLYEVTEIRGFAITMEQSPGESEFPLKKITIRGLNLSFKLNDAEKIVQEKTVIKSMSLTLIDYPFYTHFIIEERFSFKPD